MQRTLDEAATSHPERPIDSTLAGDPAGTWDAERLRQVDHQPEGNARTTAAPTSRCAQVDGTPPRGGEHHGVQRRHHSRRAAATSV